MASEVEKLNKDMIKNMSELEDSQIKGKGFDMKAHFMSDRQIAKKMISTKDPKITDEDLNLIVFGQDVKKLQGPSYEAYKTDNEIKIIGKRPGEKLHESMISSTESYKTIIKDNFYIITPEIQININYEDIYGNIYMKEDIEYSSGNNDLIDNMILKNLINIKSN